MSNLVKRMDLRRAKAALQWMLRGSQLRPHPDPRAVPSARPAPFLRAVSFALLAMALGGVLLWSAPAQAQVVNTNTEPTFDDGDTATRTVPENSMAGTNVGTAVAASDSDSGDTLTYSLTGTDAGKFDIDLNGQIKTKLGVTYNFEDASNNSFSVTVNVRDSKDAAGGADTVVDDMIAVTITVTNVDEAGTVTLPSSFSGGTAATASVTDPDGTVSSASWSWARGNTATGTFNNISGATSATYTPVAADVGKYLRATVTYKDAQSTTTNKTASVVSSSTVVGSNSAPTFSSTTATRTLPENSGAGVNVVGGVITATDSDSGDTLTYSLTGTDAGKFDIDSNGQIKTKTGVTHNFNFEATKKSFSVTVTVRDSKDTAGGADTVVVDTIAVTINLTNVNEAPTFTSPPATARFAENGTGTVVDFVATDVDASDTLFFLTDITAGDGFKFELDATTGVLTFNNPPDFEMPTDIGDTFMNNTYVVTVKVQDRGLLSATHTVTVTVTNVNEAPEITTTSGTYTAFNVDENTATSAVIKTYEASDVDASSTLTWSLEGNDSGDFTITKNAQGQGELKFRNVPNHEMPADTGANNVYDVTVKVTDNGSPKMSDTHAVTVTVTDVNEAPVITSPPATRSVPENSTAVHTFAASDVDASTTFLWSVEPADDGGKFEHRLLDRRAHIQERTQLRDPDRCWRHCHEQHLRRDGEGHRQRLSCYE